ncbi:hypothetical protein AGMMS49944_21130 [Spirochaetia bacterium]|nr:hypothetical protein AGMMS49944_21130 [Spirochaetia bacterium]
MTAKEAIKARCRDCSGKVCDVKECALKGLARAKGKVKKSVILAYCRWCLHGHPFKVCSSPDCAIYQYRTRSGENLQNGDSVKKQGVQRGFFNGPRKIQGMTRGALCSTPKTKKRRGI